MSGTEYEIANNTCSEAMITAPQITSHAAAPSDPSVLYLGTKPPRVFASEDSGESWVELIEFQKIPWRWFWRYPAELPFSAYVQALAVSPSDPEVILAGIEAGAVVRSGDGGLTWEGHREGAVRDCHTLAFHSSDGKWAYEAGGTGAAVSNDGGMTWSQPRTGLDRHYWYAVAADRREPSTWYVSASPGAFKAHGNGKAQAFIYRMREDGRWERLSGGLPQPLNHMPNALVAPPDSQEELYAGLSNGDVWRSPNRGDIWEQVPLNLGSIERSLIVV